RDGCELRDSTGATVGRVTSGNFSPSLGHCVAMAFVDRPCSIGEVLLADVRGTLLQATVVPMPFVAKKK
ncbi:MAG: glycine cleavage T C-terminal barrel domain-containing protein, partial [Actinomycetota bacterium]